MPVGIHIPAGFLLICGKICNFPKLRSVYTVETVPKTVFLGEELSMLLFTFVDVQPKPDLDSLMTQYGTSLLRLCYMYLKDYQLAQDAVQETFVKVFLKYSGFRAEASEKTWITRIAMNVCRDMMRRRSYRERGEEIPEYLAADPDTGPEEDAMERDRNSALLQAVENLPKIYRETLLLYYYEELKAEEIAKIQHTARSTVNVRLKRGRDMLREALRDESL
jgi:RNA polymerase sigma-70 factor (ECF subfamily)